MNASMSLMEAAPTEAEQVQAIWNEVGVGSDGYLDINDLSTVCQHIGMEDMDEEVRWCCLRSSHDKSFLHHFGSQLF